MVGLDWLECLRHQQEVEEVKVEVTEETMMEKEVLGWLEWKGVEMVVERLLQQSD